jgi:ATP-binding cassette, subfamily B, multidrug efflux pump
VVDAYTNIHAVKLFAHHDREVDYAKEAIEHARQTFQKEMRIFTRMDVGLVDAQRLPDRRGGRLGGLAVVGGTASLGVVAAAAALTLRLNAMTGWIMWAVSSFFRNLGVIAEGMETIAQPITLTDARMPAGVPRRGGSSLRA